MRSFPRFLILVLASVAILSCERDDICVDPVTPKLILRFYDSENPELFKQVVNLKVIIIGTDGEYENETLGALTDSVALPVNVDGNLTRYELILQGSEAQGTEDNTDIFQITYVQEDLFVSRPCGFKAVFNEVEPGLETDGNNWIDEIIPVSSPLEVNNENAAHVKIYH